MGYLNNVEAGGATAFCKPFKEEIIQPRKGSITFWYSLGMICFQKTKKICYMYFFYWLKFYFLDTKGHRLGETLHGGCPILKGSKWIFNKWIYYFDQWRKFPCGLNPDDTFDPPKYHF